MIPQPYAGLALAAVLACTHLAAYWHGQRVEQGDQAARDRSTAEQLRDQAIAYAGEIVERQAAVDRLAIDIEAARAAQAPKTQIITREVIRYATLPADRRCTLDGAWRVLHDAAATGAPPDPGAAGLAAHAAQPVDDAAALETVAGNYATCNDVAAQLVGWQSWWHRVSAGDGDH